MRRGFTLLEVMIALAIFSISVLAVANVTTGQLRSLSILEEKMIAGWIADNQISLLYLSSDDSLVRTKSGSVDMAGKRWYWRSVPLESETPLLQAINIDISLNETFTTISAHHRVYLPSHKGGVEL